MNKKTAQKLITKTRDDYNLIADQFASTRKHNWPQVKTIVAELLGKFDSSKKLRVLDIGCGSGRVFELFEDKNVEYFGIDLSDELIKIAKESYPTGHFSVGDATDLPFKANEFDIVISIAAIHHIPSTELRQEFCNEMFRVCKPGGTVFIETWYFWNKKEYLGRIFKSFFTYNGLPFGDFYRPWSNSKGEKKTGRYFHAWRVGELKDCLKKADFNDIQIRNFTRSSRNLDLLCKK